jgi:tetratricopeptide (TPR) repeat protein
MRKINLLLAILFITGIVSAQKTKVNNAFNYLRKGSIEKAKLAIDEASENEDTKNNAETWFYKGDIYLSISANPDPEIRALDTNALDKAYEYFQKSIAIDKDVENSMLGISNPFDGIKIIAVEFSRKGQLAFEAGKFLEAYNCYSKSNKYNKDETALYMAAISGYNYEQTKNPKTDTLSLVKETKTCFKELADGGYKNENVFFLLTNMYLKDNDTVRAVKYANKALEQFPDSVATLLVKCNVYYWANKPAEAATALDKVKSLAKTPEAFQKIGEILEKTNFIEAEKAYKAAIDLKPDFFESNFNLGALYFNKFVDIKKRASNLKTDQQAEYDSLKIESKKYLDLAKPIVEKCYLTNPKDYGTVLMLKQIYANTNEKEKADKKAEELKLLKP